MPHGAPDWWGLAAKETTYTLEDLAEQAARLGSVDTYNRQGDTVLYDDFGQGYAKWIQTVTGGRGNIRVHDRNVRMSPYSIELLPGNVGGDYATLETRLPHPELGGWSLELGFLPNANTQYLELRLQHYDGTNRRTYEYRYDHTTGNFFLNDNGLGWVLVDTVGPLPDSWLAWSTIKVVVDTYENAYERIHLNRDLYGVSQYHPVLAVSALYPALRVRIRTSSIGADAEFYVDYVLVKQNEPIIEG